MRPVSNLAPSRPLTCEKSAASNRSVTNLAAHLPGSSSLANANGPNARWSAPLIWETADGGHCARGDLELFQLHVEPTALHQDVTDNRWKRVLNCEDTLRGLPDGLRESERSIGWSPVARVQIDSDRTKANIGDVVGRMDFCQFWPMGGSPLAGPPYALGVAAASSRITVSPIMVAAPAPRIRLTSALAGPDSTSCHCCSLGTE